MTSQITYVSIQFNLFKKEAVMRVLSLSELNNITGAVTPNTETTKAENSYDFALGVLNIAAGTMVLLAPYGLIIYLLKNK